MRIPLLLLLPPTLAAAGLTARAQALASVPAARTSQVPGAAAFDAIPTEGWIRCVGSHGGDGRPADAPPRVMAFPVSEAPAAPVKAPEEAPQGGPDGSVPAGAHWPDAAGRVVLGDEQGPGRGAGMRNPWEVRVHAGNANETVLACGGIIEGGEGGAVAFLNGRVAVRGDTLGEFTVARVLGIGAVLEKNGAYVVLPRGTRVTVVTPAH